MKRIVFLLILFLVALGSLNAQERLVFAGKTTEGFTVDMHGNIYCWSGNGLVKHNTFGEEDLQHNAPSLGEITSVDASIPSRIQVFYQSAGIIQILDNNLVATSGDIDLTVNNLTTITATAMTSTNRMALFDKANQELLLTDLDLNILNRTRINLPKDINASSIVVIPEHNILLVDTAEGIYWFDAFGTFLRKMPMSGISHVQTSGNDLYYLRDNIIYHYNRQRMDIRTFYEPKTIKAKEFRLSGNRLLLLDTAHDLYTVNL